MNFSAGYISLVDRFEVERWKKDKQFLIFNLKFLINSAFRQKKEECGPIIIGRP